MKINIFDISSVQEFNAKALELFRRQCVQVRPYKLWLENLGISPQDVTTVERIPFLPISVFKTHKVLADGSEAALVFKSSGTSGQVRSEHWVPNVADYVDSFTKGFEQRFGALEDYVLLGFLPSYQENKNSSLLYMLNHMASATKDSQSNINFTSPEALLEAYQKVKSETNKKIMVWGVSYALLDLAEAQHSNIFAGALVFETGGMKGRRQEMIKKELHNRLKVGLGAREILSEYGMCELFSQAWSLQDGVFQCPPWMQVQAMSVSDPFEQVQGGKTGRLNIIDLANQHSCAFIQTEDLGRTHDDRTFEVLGRMDGAEARGCNLLQF